MKVSTVLIFIFLLIFVTSCSTLTTGVSEKTIRILATSDVHGKFCPYDYMSASDSLSGSMAQIASVIKQRRTEDTIVVDAGDLIQGNFAEIFLKSKGYDTTHPMAKALNSIGYDAWCTGNHEYNWGMENLKAFISSVNVPLITGNVRENGVRLGKPYVIIKRNGVRIALIGATTPNIKFWDKDKLKDVEVTNPIDEIKGAIAEIGDKADIFIAVVHMGLENEFDVYGSGCRDLANECPQLSLIVASHSHEAFCDEFINGVRIIENEDSGKTVTQVDLQLERKSGKWTVVDSSAENIHAGDFTPDDELLKITESDDEYAREFTSKPIGCLHGTLIKEEDSNGFCNVALEDTPWMHFIADVERSYSDNGSVFVVTPVLETNAVTEGEFYFSSISSIYRFGNNRLFNIRMNGKQLKKFMEWNAGMYNTFKPGDLTVSYNPKRRFYYFCFFQGICYDVNIAKESGKRIENLTWKDGKPIDDSEEFVVVTSDYLYQSVISVPGLVFDEGEIPICLNPENSDKCVFDIIVSYITDVLKGDIRADESKTWKLTGIERDEEAYNRVVQLVKEGKIKPEFSSDGRTPNVKSITKEELSKLNLHKAKF
ncbi:MAG: 5'-nucleotidase C-terminal domain-containing protein [Sphaerochaetaceae bacterium]|nr:5'-nucleotidase C-terminal domain-containing protein [Sphaerochaetaceae bacterium]